MKIKLILLLFFCTAGYSQQNITFADGRGAFQANSSNFITIDNDNTIDVEGSKYIQENYIPATISVYSGYKFNVRYNAYDDDMEVEGKDNKSFALNKGEKNLEVTFLNTNTTYSLYTYTNKENKTIAGYFQKLTSGEKVTLLKKEKIRSLLKLLGGKFVMREPDPECIPQEEVSASSCLQSVNS